MSPTRALPLLILVLSGCKDLTSFVVGETVKTGKEVTAGVVEGVEEGRKAGESVDGAVLVTTAADLDANGGVAVHAVEAGGAGSNVSLAFDNKGDKPLRISGVEVLVLDADGFVSHPTTPVNGVTVPPRAKDRLVVEFGVAPDKIKTVRVWGKDLAVTAP